MASVDGTGKVTAITNGTARIVASAEQVADTAIITVAQRAVTLTVTPVRDTIEAGEFVQLSVAAADANGHPVPVEGLTWSSADTTIATVSGSGRVTGKFRGEVRITVRSGAIEGTATINVNIADFRPTSNTTIAGAPVFGRLDIPAGVTVTVSSALNVRVLDSLRISGTLRGDCVNLSITVEGPMRVGGTVDNRCTSAAGVAKALRLINDDEIQFDSTAVIRGGSITVSNNAAVAARLRGTPPWLAASTFAVSPAPCVHRGLYEPANGTNGLDGSPRGDNGGNGSPIVFDCTGDLTINADMYAGGGGNGGDGTASASQGGTGGRGGKGGDLILKSGTRISLFGEFAPGGGGAGGAAKGGPDTKPEAIGGDGGAPGAMVVSAPTTSITAAHIVYGFIRGRGGDATVTAPNGANATASTPAQTPVAGIARGGSAGQIPNDVRLLGDIFTGPITGGLSLRIDHVTVAEGVNGGTATVKGGKGGDGSREFKNGGAGPAHQVSGGFGMSVRVIDNRTGVPVGTPGDGGSAGVQNTFGGLGWSDCLVGSIEPGGEGGAGGVPVMAAGPGGTSPGGSTGQVGKVILLNAANGGDGGNGEQFGAGGAAGNVTVVVGIADAVDSFFLGFPGRPCSYNAIAQATKPVDPAGHEPFLNVMQITQGSVKLLPNNGIEVNFGIKMTGTITRQPNGDFTFTANGSGTIAGHPATGTFTQGKVSVGSEGRVLTVTGIFSFGVGNELPGGLSVSYEVGLIPLHADVSLPRNTRRD